MNDGSDGANVTAPSRAFPGWRMVRVLAVTETVSYGVLFYCFTVMLPEMRRDLDASTAEVSGALSLSIAVNALAAVPVGRWLDRHGARGLMAAGSLLGAGSVLAWSRAGDLPELYLAFIGIGLAGAAVLYEPAFAVVNTWFLRRRRAALLTLTVVAGFSSTIFIPGSQLLVDLLGWRDALVVLALLLAACALPQALVLRRAPADLGLRPDGEGTRAGEAPAPAPGGRTAPAGGGVEVRWLTAAAALHVVAVTVVAVHLVGLLLDRGVDATAAAAAAGALGALSVAGRIAVTVLATTMSLGRLSVGVLAAQAVAVVLLFALPMPAGAVAFVVLFGCGFGVMTIARVSLLGDYVSTAQFASTSARQSAVMSVGRVVAPATAGVLITSVGYDAAFTAVGVCLVGAAACLLAADATHASSPHRPAVLEDEASVGDHVAARTQVGEEDPVDR